MKHKDDADFFKQSYIEVDFNDLQDFEAVRMSVAESHDFTKEDMCFTKDPAKNSEKTIYRQSLDARKTEKILTCF